MLKVKMFYNDPCKIAFEIGAECDMMIMSKYFIFSD